MGPELLSQIREGGILYVILLVAVCMHEFGHAYAADKLGDKLPRLDGRVTLNPAAHMDMLGTVILPLVTIFLSMGTGFPLVFGWGKPVRVFLDNPKTRVKVDIISTAGGLAMNLVVAAASALAAGVLFALSALLSSGGGMLSEFADVAVLSMQINCMLFIINMIPVPPLDGSRFLKYALGMSEATYESLARYGIIIFLVLINIPAFSQILRFLVGWLAFMFSYLAHFSAWVCGLICGG